MIDIFDEPKLYVADITIEFLVKTKQAKKHVKMTKKFFKHPIILLNNKPATENCEKRFMKLIYDKITSSHLPDSLKITNIENVKFSSKLAYKFDFAKH